jgi:alpha-tubulin suppressor-like RCC1 family protein
VLAAAIALPMALQAAPAIRAPVVTGTAHVGGTLTAKVATPAAKGTKYIFQWQTQKKVTVKKKTVTRWVAIARASKATFVPTAGLKGSSVRACVKAKGTKSAWKCSGAKVVAAALTPAAPTPAAPAPPNPLSVSYLTQRFITGSGGTVLSPTTTGGSGTKRFEVTAGTLPDGVTFDQGTGTFTGPAASAWNFRATQIAAGDLHTCALTTTGGVKCWGSGSGGELGNGATSSQSTPVDVVATGQGPGGTALSGITQITAGGSHTCALTTSGGVKCWGFGAFGQLGNGATSEQSTPVDVVATGQSQGGTPLSGVTQITAGGVHTCALTTSGGVKCWGDGFFGQLGNGATSNQSTPVDVFATGGGGNGNLSGITQITAGTFHTCALTTSGGVKCWGSGLLGRLGNGATPTSQSTPVDVVATGQSQGGTALLGITQVTAGGDHTCALTTSGGVKCWGLGADGQLGNGATPTSQSTPVDVVATLQSQNGTPLSGVIQITAGAHHTCALTTSGGVKCWGFGANGQLGNGAASNQSTPVDVTRSGEQPGFPAALSVTVTDDTGSWTLGRVVLGTK